MKITSTLFSVLAVIHVAMSDDVAQPTVCGEGQIGVGFQSVSRA